MKFSKDTLNILKNFSAINPSMMLKPGTFVMTKSINGTAYAETTIADEITDELGIYDLNSFLNIIQQFGDDVEVNLDAQTANIVISNKRSKVFYAGSDASTIVAPKQRLQMPVADVIFNLTADDLSELMKITRVVNASHIVVTARDGRLVIDAFHSDSGAKTLYSLDICEYEGTNKFRFIININSLRFLPGDYKVLISAKGAAKFEGTQAAYVVVLEATSESDF